MPTPTRRTGHRRCLGVSGLACVVLLAACGTRVDPAVFDRLYGLETTSAPPSQVGTATGDVLVPGTADTPGSLPAGEGAATPEGPAAAGGPTAAATPTAAGGPTGVPPRGGPTGSPSPTRANRASDVGVSADRIVVGNISDRGGPLGAQTFTPMLQGAQAYFARLNARGGVNGRRIELLFCDSKEDPDRNRQCARNLVEQEKVFAFVANSSRAYAGAEYVSAQGVPDVGGQPVGFEYFTHPTLYAVRGAEYPRDGTVGHRGRLYNGTAIFRYLRQSLGLRRAAVFYYNIPVSVGYGKFQAAALRAEGYEVTEYEVNPALPSFDSYVADMRAKRIEGIFDAMDLTGNQNLCQSMARSNLAVKAKVGIVSSWSRRVKEQFPEICRRSMYVWGESMPYTADTAEMRLVRTTISEVHGGRLDASLAQWHVEGWLAAQMFTEGVARMGADVTRKGLMAWLDGFTPSRPYGFGGLMVPQSWQPLPYDRVKQVDECIAVARWEARVADFATVPQGFPVCYRVPLIAWNPPT